MRFAGMGAGGRSRQAPSALGKRSRALKSREGMGERVAAESGGEPRCRPSGVGWREAAQERSLRGEEGSEAPARRSVVLPGDPGRVGGSRPASELAGGVGGVGGAAAGAGLRASWSVLRVGGSAGASARRGDAERSDALVEDPRRQRRRAADEGEGDERSDREGGGAVDLGASTARDDVAVRRSVRPGREESAGGAAAAVGGVAAGRPGRPDRGEPERWYRRLEGGSAAERPGAGGGASWRRRRTFLPRWWGEASRHGRGERSRR